MILPMIIQIIITYHEHRRLRQYGDVRKLGFYVIIFCDIPPDIIENPGQKAPDVYTIVYMNIHFSGSIFQAPTYIVT